MLYYVLFMHLTRINIYVRKNKYLGIEKNITTLTSENRIYYMQSLEKCIPNCQLRVF